MGYYGYKKRRKRLRTGTLLLLLLFCALFLVSCVTGANTLWVKGILGLDLTDYRAETVSKTLPLDGAVSDSLCYGIELLTVNTLDLKPFTKASQAVTYYREEILNSMLCEGYSHYTANSTSLSKVAAAYPNLNASTFIPAADLENTVSRYFGTQRVRHQDGELFKYLERAECYNFSLKAWERTVEVIPERIEETYHTYRFFFRLTDGEQISEPYCAVFVKRNDGTCYIRALDRE